MKRFLAIVALTALPLAGANDQLVDAKLVERGKALSATPACRPPASIPAPPAIP
jgi:hypothetical protein